MQTLVVYYSRSGHARKIGDELAKALGCEAEEIKDTVKRSGPIGWLLSGRDGSGRRLTKLQPVKKDPAGYDLLVIGTPIWAGNMSSPVRTYLTENKAKLKNVAFFCTEDKSGDEKAFKEMEELTGKKPKATMAVTTKDLKTGGEADKIKKFAAELKA